jgi:hypothetical protein
MGAPTPMAAYVGTSPIAAVESPTPASTVTMIFLRPIRSASSPKSAAPPGRSRMLTANEAKTRARLSVSLSAGNICRPIVLRHTATRTGQTGQRTSPSPTRTQRAMANGPSG